MCVVIYFWEVFIVGVIGGVFVILFCYILDRLRIDDLVGVSFVYGVCGVWVCDDWL